MGVSTWNYKVPFLHTPRFCLGGHADWWLSDAQMLNTDTRSSLQDRRRSTTRLSFSHQLLLLQPQPRPMSFLLSLFPIPMPRPSLLSGACCRRDCSLWSFWDALRFG